MVIWRSFHYHRPNSYRRCLTAIFLLFRGPNRRPPDIRRYPSLLYRPIHDKKTTEYSDGMLEAQAYRKPSCSPTVPRAGANDNKRHAYTFEGRCDVCRCRLRQLLYIIMYRLLTGRETKQQQKWQVDHHSLARRVQEWVELSHDVIEGRHGAHTLPHAVPQNRNMPHLATGRFQLQAPHV